MFGWFRAECLVGVAAKQWIEDRLRWLDQEFPRSAFRGGDVILPTPAYFPDPYDGSKASVRALLERVCGYMGIAPRLVSLELFTEKRALWLVNEEGRDLPTGAAGLYEESSRRFIIRIETSQLDRPMDLVGTIAHELSHLRLLGEKRISHDAFDNELLTDLTAVFHGFGIFLANSPRHWDGHYTLWPRTNLKKPEYMTAPMYGYALAHLAWHRNETKPPWAKELRWDARVNLKQGMRYLHQTKDSAFTPWHVELGLGE